MSYRPLWTGIGIIAGWLAAILGPSFYARKWIGVEDLALAAPLDARRLRPGPRPVIGAGTDGRSPWLIAMLGDPHRSDRLRVHVPHAPQAVTVQPYHTTGGPAHRRPEVGAGGPLAALRAPSARP